MAQGKREVCWPPQSLEHKHADRQVQRKQNRWVEGWVFEIRGACVLNTQLTQKMITVRHRDWTAPVLLSRCMSALHSSAPAAQCTRDLEIQKKGAKRTRWRLHGQTSLKGRIVAEPPPFLFSRIGSQKRLIMRQEKREVRL